MSIASPYVKTIDQNNQRILELEGRDLKREVAQGVYLDDVYIMMNPVPGTRTASRCIFRAVLYDPYRNDTMTIGYILRQWPTLKAGNKTRWHIFTNMDSPAIACRANKKEAVKLLYDKYEDDTRQPAVRCGIGG